MNIVEVVRVRFRWPGKMYEFRNPLELSLKRGNSVVVQTDEGDELIGTVMIAPRLRLARREDEVLPTVLRIASDREMGMADVADDFRLEVKNFFDTRMRSREMNGVKLVDVEKANGGQKLILYFASEQKRFNYRELAVEMAQRFKVRVDMRPVGIRDAARLSGGIGKCGLSLCCSTWLPDFQQISIRMAKDQGLSLDPESINGQCGRLLCCLGYEHQNYVEMGQGLPKVGKAVVTPKGDARVVKLDILQGKITVRFEDGAYETYQSNEVKRKFGAGGQVQDSNSDDDDGSPEAPAEQNTSDGPRPDFKVRDFQPRDQSRDQPREQSREQSRDQNRPSGRQTDRPSNQSRNAPRSNQDREAAPARERPNPAAASDGPRPDFTIREFDPNKTIIQNSDRNQSRDSNRDSNNSGNNDQRGPRRNRGGGGRGPNRGDQGPSSN
jgi:cell fate regulator YaaT (PSP1 superfamily)